MKTILILLTFLLPALLPAQESLIIAGFRGKPSDGVVLLQWTVNSGQTCKGTRIERSTDTLHFETVGEIPGICGSSETAISYTFTDFSPLPNQMNYYRLELGGQGYSPILSIPYFEFGESGYFLFPNPAQEQANIWFAGTSETEYQLELFDLSGNRLILKRGKGNEITLDTGSLPASVCLFRILPDGRMPVSGRIVVRGR